MLFVLAPLASPGQGVFDGHTDVGHPKLSGSATYDEATQTYTLRGAGSNIWFDRDEFQFVYKQLDGDFILTADFALTGDTAGAVGHRKTGWMIRESLDDDAASFEGAKHMDGLTVLQWRPEKGVMMKDPDWEIFYPKKGCQTMQLERTGNLITMRVANPGEPLQLVGSVQAATAGPVYAGLYVCAHYSNSVAEAKVWNVRIDRPGKDLYYPNPQVAKLHPPSGQVLLPRTEVVDIGSGRRLTAPLQGVPENAVDFISANLTGTQQIWRHSEGAQPEQLTYDEYENWYPRLSPDEKWIVFLSFPPWVDPSMPPEYAPVLMRIMPAAGGAPKVIAYFQGGRQSLGSDCWSADSRHVYFTSYY